MTNGIDLGSGCVVSIFKKAMQVLSQNYIYIMDKDREVIEDALREAEHLASLLDEEINR